MAEDGRRDVGALAASAHKLSPCPGDALALRRTAVGLRRSPPTKATLRKGFDERSELDRDDGDPDKDGGGHNETALPRHGNDVAEAHLRAVTGF